ncbi:MAG: hypothetical protein QOC95_1800 [Thermoleophilaceae bacterium]|jgi:hypothetical protein|nr:hypothetical protein [Thermoleophilaceae bacterium]
MRGDSAEELRLQRRRFLVMAAVWIVGTWVYYAIGGLDFGFAVVVGAVGGASALGIALYWGWRARKAGR